MFKFRLAAAAAIACAVTLLSSGAQAYPDCGIDLDLDINNSTLVGGKSFSYTADSGDEICDWAVTYRGDSQEESGTTSISGSFSTPVVTKKTVNKITASCTHVISDEAAAPADSGSNVVTPAIYSAQPSAVAQAPVTATCSVSANVTLLPKGGADNNDDGALPDTGGSNLWILVLGGALVVAGGGITYAARRRHSAR